MTRVGSWLEALAAAFVLLSASAQAGFAQTCNFSISGIDFGSIDVTSNVAYTTSATYSASCSALLSATRTCPSLGEGSGGSSSGSPRYLVNGSNRLAYNLFSDSGYSTIWGSMVWGFPYPAPSIDIATVILGNGTISAPVYARIPNGQQSLPAGTYISTFSGVQTKITYGAYLAGLFPPNCATLTTPSRSVSFTVTAKIVPQCAVTASVLDFGATGKTGVNLDARNTLALSCTAATPFTVALDGGTSGATDPTQRRMKKGGESVIYGLYRDASRTQPWGNSAGVNTLSATGTGFEQPLSVYGRVPPQPTPSPGTYLDTIVVTVTY